MKNRILHLNKLVMNVMNVLWYGQVFFQCWASHTPARSSATELYSCSGVFPPLWDLWLKIESRKVGAMMVTLRILLESARFWGISAVCHIKEGINCWWWNQKEGDKRRGCKCQRGSVNDIGPYTENWSFRNWNIWKISLFLIISMTAGPNWYCIVASSFASG